MWGSMSVVIAFASLGESGEGGRRGGTEEDNVVGNFPFHYFSFFLFLLFISLFITPLLELLFNKY